MLDRLKFSAAILFLYVFGLIHRSLFRDPLADFFAEMEKSGRLNINDDDPKQLEISAEAGQRQ